MVEKTKQFIENVNKYLGLLIIVPAVLGGLWQVLELARLSPSFIRFFSVTQVASDGLLILFILIIIILGGYLPYWLMKLRFENQSSEQNESDESNESEEKINFQRQQVIAGLILLFGAFLAFWFLLKPLVETAYNDFNLTNFVISLFFIMVLIQIFFTSVATLSRVVIEKSPKTKNYISNILIKKPKNELSIFAQMIGAALMIGLFYLALNLIFLVGTIRNTYFIPKNLRNMENIECLARKDNPQIASAKVIYFNDKFFFIDVTDNSQNKQIIVIKFDELFNNNCKNQTNN